MTSERRNSDDPPRLSIHPEYVGRPRRRSIAVDNISMFLNDPSETTLRKQADVKPNRDQRRPSLVEKMVHQQIEYSDKLLGRSRARRASLSQVIPLKNAATRAENVTDTVTSARKLLEDIDKRKLVKDRLKDVSPEPELVSRTRRFSIQAEPGYSGISSFPSGRRHSAIFTRESSPGVCARDSTEYISRLSPVPLIKLHSPTYETQACDNRDRSISSRDGRRSVHRDDRIPDRHHLSPTGTQQKSRSTPNISFTDTDLMDETIHDSYIQSFRKEKSLREFEPTSSTGDCMTEDDQGRQPNPTRHRHKEDKGLTATVLPHDLGKDISTPNRDIETQDKHPDVLKVQSSPNKKTNGKPEVKIKSGNREFGSRQTAARLKQRHAHTEKLQKLLKELEEDMPMQAKLKLQELRREITDFDEDLS